MFRKLILALGATAVIGAVALAPTTASAKPWGGPHWHHHYHGGWGIGFYPTVISGDCYYVKQNVPTPNGYQVQYVQVCN